MYKQFNLLDLVILLIKKKITLIKWIFSFTLIAVIVAFLLPKKYKSTTQFLISTQSVPSVGGLLSTLIPTAFGSSKLGAEQAAIFLKGRTIKEKIIKSFNFDSVYQTKVIEETLREVEANTLINENREGGFAFNPIITIELSFIDESPKRAQEVVSMYISTLDSIMTHINRQSSVAVFKVIDDQYQKNMLELAEAENRLKEFQEKTGIIQIEEQAKASIEALAVLKQKMIELELQKNLLEIQGGVNNFALNQINTQIAAVKKEYDKLVSKENTIATKTKNDGYFAIDQYPDLIQQYANAYRDVVVQNKLFEYIYPLYLQQLAQVENSNSGIQLVDPPSYPTYKDSPKRAIIIVGGTLAGFIFGMIHVLMIHFVNNSSAEVKEKLSYFGIREK